MKCSERAFTLMDLLVTIGFIALLALVCLPPLAKAKVKAQRITCTSHLKCIGLSFRTFATDHQNKYPMILSTNAGGTAEWMAMKSEGAPFLYMSFRCISNELGTPKLLLCPTDNKIAAANWNAAFTSGKNGSGNGCISYGLGMDAQEQEPSMLLAMDRNITNDNGGNGTRITANNAQSQCGRLGSAAPATSSAGWAGDMHMNCGQAALADGSVQGLSNARLKEQLYHSGGSNNWIVIPAKGSAPN